MQYAFSASSPMPCDPSGHWSPREAEGESQAWGQTRGGGEGGTEQRESHKDSEEIWEGLIIPACNMDRASGQRNIQIPAFWPLSPAPAHELSEFQELEHEFHKAAECQEMLTIHICQTNSSGELFTPSTPTPKVRSCYLFRPDLCCLRLVVNSSGLQQQPDCKEVALWASALQQECRGPRQTLSFRVFCKSEPAGGRMVCRAGSAVPLDLHH